MDIIERLRATIVNETPARYPDVIEDAIASIERHRRVLNASLVAMRVASALPNVANEYDFEPVIGEIVTTLKD